MSSISLKHLRISLGFDDASAGWQTLCKKTAEFRKSYIRCNSVTFPWKCDAIAQESASDFFAKNEVLFDASSRLSKPELRRGSRRINYVPQTRHASYFRPLGNTYNLLSLDSAGQTRRVSAGTVVERPKLPPAPIPESRFTLTSLSTIETEQRTPIDTKPSTHRAQESIVTPASLSTTETMQPTPPLFHRASAPSPLSSPFQLKRLQFILENSKRSPDYDNPLPDSDFRTLSLLEFFALFCQRGSRAREATSHLTFQYNWGQEGRKEEVDWEEIKERVRDTFLIAKDKYEKRVRFQVWVIGPEDENEDEEW
ncbi:uncharacterized protein PAC_15181 [Phialocephala subalpina]|uniref:Uncharacterized protein n=1 Tax=Phialocephala subalpina TaxID=576137 RepID=A0A1L7XJQ7_9HELO|nr:uncharacterized protein PAC_15181 [Phialocephala subalpina]